MANNRDNELIEEYLSGDEKSLEVLIKDYVRPIFGFVFRYVGDVSTAEDITQKTFVKVWRHYHENFNVVSFARIWSIRDNRHFFRTLPRAKSRRHESYRCSPLRIICRNIFYMYRLSCGAGPARRAASLNPIEALRYE